MKQLILTIIVIAGFGFGLKSQEYVPFPAGNVNWNVYLRHTCLETPPDTFLLRYAIHGDTIFGSNTYKRLCLEHGDTLNPVIEPIGGWREVDKKIYYFGRTILHGVYEEVLLYDFNKQTGDTIRHDSQGGFYSVILGIDSVLIDGKYRKRYYVDNHWFYHRYDYIIEGIGSVKNSLLGHVSDIPTCGTHYWEFICFRENGEVKYLNPSFNDCFPPNLLAGATPVAEDAKIRIYPNPVKDRLQVENNTGQNLTLKMMETQGRLVVNQHLNTTLTVVQPKIQPGIYLVLITNGSGQIAVRQKIVKQ